MNSTLEQIHEFTTLGDARVFAVGRMDEGHLVDVRQQTVRKQTARASIVLRYRVFEDEAIRFATGFCIFTNQQPDKASPRTAA